MSLAEPHESGAIRIFTRPGCHLCEQLIDEILPMIRGHLELEVCDVDSRPDWKLKFGLRIPVVEYAGDTVCQYRLDAVAIRAILDSLPACGSGFSRE